jgi:hypothetical protein
MASVALLLVSAVVIDSRVTAVTKILAVVELEV